jgi:hypothetical protein
MWLVPRTTGWLIVLAVILVIETAALLWWVRKSPARHSSCDQVDGASEAGKDCSEASSTASSSGG